MRKIIVATAAISVLTLAATAMPHVKPGLWNITTDMKMKNMPDIPPEALAMMKQRGMKIPGMGEPVVTQVCMTPQDVADGTAMGLKAQNDAHIHCDPKVLSETGSSMATSVVCHGEMEGTGHSEVNWREGHYEGNYSFRGVMHGQPNETSTHFVGEFVKADCGSVKPYSAMRH
jgi:hypothetical protein